jgi:type III secretion protein D
MLELRILTGLHRGAALPLEGDAIRLGSAAENDIVLLDPGMPEIACAIFRSEESGWRYRTSASARSDGKAFDVFGATDSTALAPGARWFAGPVLVGCDE